MAIKTISKNGKRVPASEKGKEGKKAKAPKKDKSARSPAVASAVRGLVNNVGSGVSSISISTSSGESVTIDAAAAKRIRENIDRTIGPESTGNGPATGIEPAPLYRLTIPTDIGKVCHKDGTAGQQAVAILRDHTDDDHVFLTATDGRILAVVRADQERVGNVEGAGLHAGWVRREMATTSGGDGRTLRLTKGTAETLFGDGLKWVDDQEGWFLEVPDGGQFPPVHDLFPLHLITHTCVRVRASALVKLAAALNSAETDDRDALTLVIQEDADGGVSKPVIVIGNRGFGLMMPAPQNTEGTLSTYRSMLRTFQQGRPRGKKPADPEQAMNPAPLDMAQQFPITGARPPEMVVDETTGEVRELHRDPTGQAEYALTTPLPEAAADDDGKDGPSNPINVAEMTLSAETKAALANVGIVTVKDVADYIEDGGDLSLLAEGFSDLKRLHDCAKPFLPEPADSAA